MMFLYSFLLGAGFAISSPWLVFRMITTRRYREGLRERLGRVPNRLRVSARDKHVVWVHAVSVGEVLAASQLIDSLEGALSEAGGTKAGWRVLISTTTRTGQVLARERFGEDRVFWFPLDFAWAVRAWLRSLQPELLVLVESELWPRLLRESNSRGIPVAVVNARMSDRSFQRARRVRYVWRRVLRGVSVFLAQSEETAERLRLLGVAPSAINVVGNLKYDTQPRQTSMVQALRPLLARRSLVVAGSLLAPEEEFLLEHWPEIARSVPQPLLLLAPRHPERFDEVTRSASARFRTVRATALQVMAPGGPGSADAVQPEVVVLDTVGDLPAVYGLADVAFVGGSLVPKGGHNPLEPARFGVPVVMGFSIGNFREIVAEMEAAKGIEIVHSEEELFRTLQRLLHDRVEADALGQRGKRVFARKSGATGRSIAALLSLLEDSRPGRVGGGR